MLTTAPPSIKKLIKRQNVQLVFQAFIGVCPTQTINYCDGYKAGEPFFRVLRLHTQAHPPSLTLRRQLSITHSAARCRMPFDSYMYFYYFSMYYSCHDILFILCNRYSLLHSLPLPPPPSTGIPPSLILPFLSCQILADATGQCLTF